MKKGQMGGPFYTKSYELHYELKRLGRGFNEFYDNMVCEAIIREHWEEEGNIWVRGTFRASKADMRTWQPDYSRRTFQSRWAKLIEAGIIEENEDGSFTIPRYKKRGQEGIREAEVKIMSQDLQETKQEVGQIKEDVREIREILQPGTDTPKAENTGNESTEAGKKIAKTGKKIAKTGKKITPPYPFKGLDKREIKEEEEGHVREMDDLKAENEPGSRGWIKAKIDGLWPGRGWKESDQEYIEELEKFSAAELTAAFNRARDDNAKYGNYEYILNYLRNPGLYNRKRRRKSDTSGKKRKDSRKSLEGSKDIGGLKADWLKDDNSTKEGDE